MPDKGNASKKWKLLKWLIAIILLISLLFFVKNLDIETVKSSLSQIGNNVFWILGTTLLAYICGALGLYYSIPKVGHGISMFKVFVVRLVGENIALINPTNTIGGESAKVYMLTQKGLDFSSAFSAVLITKFTLVITQILLFLFATLAFVFGSNDLDSGVWYILISAIASITLFFGIIYLIYKSPFVTRKLSQSEIGKKIQESTQQCKTFASELWQSNPSQLFKIVFFTTMHWVFGAIEFYFLFQAIGIEISILDAVLIDMGIIMLKSFGAFVPGQIGVEEYSNKVFFNILGITSNSVWITVSICRRIRQIFWIGVGVFLYLVVLKKMFSKSNQSSGSTLHNP